MNADRDRDRQLDDALTRALRTAAAEPAGDTCLDPETVAAWMDGGLDLEAVAMAEAHASSCARCQALLGTVARTVPLAAATSPHGARLWRWWFAPLAATAAAATLWMVVPQEPASSPVSGLAKEVVVAVAEPEARTTRAEPAASVATAAPPAAAAPSPPTAPSAAAMMARDRADVATPPPATAALEKLADQQVAQTVAELEQKAEAPKRDDRAAGGRVAAAPPAATQRQQANALADANVTARSTPSPDVIWLVGRAGLVQLATDGRTFARVPFPEAVDLTAVTATDERHAIVTTADGRTFQTADGGRTWQRP